MQLRPPLRLPAPQYRNWSSNVSISVEANYDPICKYDGCTVMQININFCYSMYYIYFVEIINIYILYVYCSNLSFVLHVHSNNECNNHDNDYFYRKPKKSWAKIGSRKRWVICHYWYPPLGYMYINMHIYLNLENDTSMLHCNGI